MYFLYLTWMPSMLYENYFLSYSWYLTWSDDFFCNPFHRDNISTLRFQIKGLCLDSRPLNALKVIFESYPISCYLALCPCLFSQCMATLIAVLLLLVTTFLMPFFYSYVEKHPATDWKLERKFIDQAKTFNTTDTLTKDSVDPSGKGRTLCTYSHREP